MNYDVIIIGTGAAGLYSALTLDKSLKVLIITKSELRQCNSYLAQGGITTVLNEDDKDAFTKDTLKAGKYKNNKEAIKVLIEESDDIVNSLLGFNMPLDMSNGSLSYTREAAHSVSRIIHSKDKSGQVLVDTLIAQLSKAPNITIYEHTTLIDILEYGKLCIGARLSKNNEIINIFSKTVILATGGIGGIFKTSTNYPSITGDGIAIALKHNVATEDTNYIQFHPTSLYSEDSLGQKFLISESVRGEGAILYNTNKEPFVDELLPRDVVTNAINDNLKKTGSKYVYLDISFKEPEFIKSHFPTIYDKCLSIGYDMCKQAIPVTPAQHYFMGGIKSNLFGETSMKNLFAIGETACTGVHGANRLASNSLLEALAFAKRCSSYINLNIKNIDFKKPKTSSLIYFDELLSTEYKKNLIINLLKEGNDSLNDELFHS